MELSENEFEAIAHVLAQVRIDGDRTLRHCRRESDVSQFAACPLLARKPASRRRQHQRTDQPRPDSAITFSGIRSCRGASLLLWETLAISMPLPQPQQGPWCEDVRTRHRDTLSVKEVRSCSLQASDGHISRIRDCTECARMAPRCHLRLAAYALTSDRLIHATGNWEAPQRPPRNRIWCCDGCARAFHLLDIVWISRSDNDDGGRTRQILPGGDDKDDAKQGKRWAPSTSRRRCVRHA